MLWEGNIVAKVEEGGQFWGSRRRIRHRGGVRSARLARRFIERWLAARPPLPPVLSKDLPPKALTSLGCCEEAATQLALGVFGSIKSEPGSQTFTSPTNFASHSLASTLEQSADPPPQSLWWILW